MGNAPPSHEIQDAWKNIQVDKQNIRVYNASKIGTKTYRKLTPIRPSPKKKVDISRYRKLTPVRRTPRQTPRQTPIQYPPPLVALGGEEIMEEAYPYIDKYGNCFIIVNGKKIECNKKLLARAYEQNNNVQTAAAAAASAAAATQKQKQQTKIRRLPRRPDESGQLPMNPLLMEQLDNVLQRFYNLPPGLRRRLRMSYNDKVMESRREEDGEIIYSV
jgi:hypothetical protein